MERRKNILIIDIDNTFLHAIRKEFSAHSACYQVAFATSSAQAMTVMKKFVVHLVVVNISLSGESGINLLLWVRKAYPDVHVVLYSDTEIHEEYKRTLLYGGASAVLRKPFHADDVVRIADNLYRNNESISVPDFVKLLGLLQMIASENSSARLEITDSASRLAGVITVQNGYLVTATTTDGQTDMEALAQMLAWKEPAILANKLLPADEGWASGMPLERALLRAVVKLDEVNTRKA
ncbi:MAG: response regulator [Desulfobulbus sp.]|nr:response regulator [Desulfobulbus sp.]